ncbi:Cyclic pyranopterin monophosphate synthase 2 [bacterium HR19]|nr:Cyclic pyranopterin monophosphate synthase 2 [bacterium HR19]
MIDVSSKIKTLRVATAEAVISFSDSSKELVESGKSPKGDIFEVSRAIACLSAKKVAEILPFCHNIPVEHVDVNFSIEGNRINVSVTVKSIARTGCEMEALFAAMVSALNIYDMLKPVDKNLKIEEVKLVEKKGGKSDFIEKVSDDFRVGVLVVSDSVAAGKKEDKSGKIIVEKLKEFGVKKIDYKIVPDEKDMIYNEVKKWCDDGYDLVITTGGTGLSPRDTTPEAVEPLIEKEIPAIMESARAYGQERTPYSMLSRGIAGVHANRKTLILTLPGSSRGAKESMDALFPYIFHIYPMLRGGRHDDKKGRVKKANEKKERKI